MGKLLLKSSNLRQLYEFQRGAQRLLFNRCPIAIAAQSRRSPIAATIAGLRATKLYTLEQSLQPPLVVYLIPHQYYHLLMQLFLVLAYVYAYYIHYVYSFLLTFA